MGVAGAPEWGIFQGPEQRSPSASQRGHQGSQEEHVVAPSSAAGSSSTVGIQSLCGKQAHRAPCPLGQVLGITLGTFDEARGSVRQAPLTPSIPRWKSDCGHPAFSAPSSAVPGGTGHLPVGTEAAGSVSPPHGLMDSSWTGHRGHVKGSVLPAKRGAPRASLAVSEHVSRRGSRGLSQALPRLGLWGGWR